MYTMHDRKYLKYFFLLFLIACSPVFMPGMYAQKAKVKNDPAYDKKPLHFGFTVGLNTMDFGVAVSKSAYLDTTLFVDVPSLRPGFNINIVSNLRLNDYFDLRFLPGIGFGQRNLVYYHDRKKVGIEQKIESSFLEFPLVVKYKATRINNFRPYLLGGVDYRIDLAARKEYDPEEDLYLRLRRSDIYYEVGFGIDFYLKYFKFSTEVKLATGVRDILVDDPNSQYPEYAQAIGRMRSNLLILSFHFE